MKFSKLVSVVETLVPTALCKTNLTGDILNGHSVITYLDLADVPSHAVSYYYLRAAELGGGLPVHIPVMVARGGPDTLEGGKTLSLSAAIHGDELNGVRVIQKVFNSLENNVDSLNGTVIGIPTVNPPGIYTNSRMYWTSGSSGALTDINRVFPGKAPDTGATGPEVLAYNIWNHIWKNSTAIDVALDFHTASTGSISPLYCYADFRLPYVERLAKLLQPEILKIDRGEPGSIETTFVEYGVPAITVELGSPKVWNQSLISRGVDFVGRVLVDLEILPPSGSANANYEPNLCNTYTAKMLTSIAATLGGFAEILVGVGEDVVKAQTLATVYNGFGKVLELVNSTYRGRVLTISGDPSVEPGRTIVKIAHNDTTEGCEAGCIT